MDVTEKLTTKRGRPFLPAADSAPNRSIRLNAARWAKFQQLGRAWLERKIDKEKFDVR